LLRDAEADRRDEIRARRAALVLGADAHLGDIAEAHEVAVGAALDDQRGEILGARQAGARAQGELALRGLEAPGGQLDVLTPQRGGDVLGRDAARRHGLAVEPDAHRVAARAADLHARHALDHGEAVDEHALGDVGQLERAVAIAGEGEPHDRLRVAVGLGDLRRVRLGGQLRRDAPDAVAHVVRGLVDVAVERELDDHRRALVAARGGQLDDALEARDLVLDDLRDARLDDFRGGAAVGRVDGHDRRVDVGVLAHRQVHRRGEADEHEEQRQHGREHRPANGEFRDLHA
jgi:hypothetical protein